MFHIKIIFTLKFFFKRKILLLNNWDIFCLFFFHINIYIYQLHVFRVKKSFSTQHANQFYLIPSHFFFFSSISTFLIHPRTKKTFFQPRFLWKEIWKRRWWNMNHIHLVMLHGLPHTHYRHTNTRTYRILSHTHLHKHFI